MKTNNIHDTITTIERLSIVACDLTAKKGMLSATCADIAQEVISNLLTTISERVLVLKELLNEKQASSNSSPS